MEEAKVESVPTEKRIYGEGIGRYIMMDGNKNYFFEFPIKATLMENYVALHFIANEVWKTIEEQKKKDEAPKEPIEVKDEGIHEVK